MCGFAGIARNSLRPIAQETMWRMAGAIRHRGPDQAHTYIADRVGLAHVRLSIIDLEGGTQPLSNAEGSIVIAYNGEVFNYRELRRELEAFGHCFRTASDTEVLIHAYERWGESMLERLNGQFAFALHDRRNGLVFLARDRFGVRPLFISTVGGDLYFASEMKALFASGEVSVSPDLRGLDEVFSLWATRAPRTTFENVEQVPPGFCCTWLRGRLRMRRYYEPRYCESAVEAREALDVLGGLMESAVALRMRADVPVGGYLSGGLDSSIACALAARLTPHPLRTFSVAFADPRFDESEHQQKVATALSTEHHVVHVGATEISDVFPEVVWHAETPLLRSAPAPMYLLARATHDAGIKVVLSGEGADELFLGYDLFKEAVVRLFCLRQPNSKLRPLLFDRLYSYLTRPAQLGDFWRRSFLGVGSTDDPLFSHTPRFEIASRVKDFYSDESRLTLAGSDPTAELRQSLPDSFRTWSPENRAAYLELTTLLPSYLLSSQGDRMAMAHGVETRFPFLDHRVFEFAASLPVSSKLFGLREKEILRRWASKFIPDSVSNRAKQPYRSPDASSFFHGSPAEYVRELMSPEAIRRVGIFDVRSVEALLKRCFAGRVIGTGENQSLIAILSTQLWYHTFIEKWFAHSRPNRAAAVETFAVPV